MTIREFFEKAGCPIPKSHSVIGVTRKGWTTRSHNMHNEWILAHATKIGYFWKPSSVTLMNGTSVDKASVDFEFFPKALKDKAFGK